MTSFRKAARPHPLWSLAVIIFMTAPISSTATSLILVSVPFLFQFLYHYSFSFCSIPLSVSVPLFFQFLFHSSQFLYHSSFNFCFNPLSINCCHSSFNQLLPFIIHLSIFVPVLAVTFRPDGSQVAVSSLDAQITFWDTSRYIHVHVCSCNVIWTIWVCSIVDSSQLLNSLSP